MTLDAGVEGGRFRRANPAIPGLSIADFCGLSIADAEAFLLGFRMTDYQQRLAGEVVGEIRKRLSFMREVGLGYLTLDRESGSLSGGEAQRIKLAAELSRVATGNTLCILDEPTTGLHFADVRRLLEVLGRLVDAGNTVIVIEHNLDVIRAADWLVDLGPEGGDGGGRVVATGTPEEVAGSEGSHTGAFLEEARERLLVAA